MPLPEELFDEPTTYTGGIDFETDRPEGALTTQAKNGVAWIELNSGSGPIGAGFNVALSRDQLLDHIVSCQLALQALDAHNREPGGAR